VPLTAAASSVLSNPRITLSEPARVDIGTGRINNNVLQIMIGLADRFTYAVQVMHTGHIQTVFPHRRLSNHAVGRGGHPRNQRYAGYRRPRQQPNDLRIRH